MEVSGIRLVANMSDGSVEQIAMGALPEPGMYRGTLATGWSGALCCTFLTDLRGREPKRGEHGVLAGPGAL
jgi:hypothetical protein